jgi:hypothetical protein
MFVDPVETPVTTPLLFTVAILVFVEIHVPPVKVLLKVIVAPSQTFVGPEIGANVGSGLTVTTT